MQGNTSPSGVTPITPASQTTAPYLAWPSPRPICLSPRGQHIAPPGDSPPQLSLSPSKTCQIQRPAPDLPDLFASVRSDDPVAVMKKLQGLSDPNVRDPETGETLVLAAARSGAYRVVAMLANDFARAVVDEPVTIRSLDGNDLHDIRATDVAVRHLGDLRHMSRWRQLLRIIENYEAGSTTWIKNGLSKLSLGHGRRVSGGTAEPLRLEDKDVLRESLGQLLERVDNLIVPKSVEGESATRDRVGAMMEAEQEVLQNLRPALQRWGDFIEQLVDIGKRPLPDPHANQGTIQDAATLGQDGSVEPLIESLTLRQVQMKLPPMLPKEIEATTEALDSLMNETDGRGRTFRMTKQQVLLAQRYFERIPESLLRDTRSLINRISTVLQAAEKPWGDRAALSAEIDEVAKRCDKLLVEAEQLRQRAIATRPKDDDSRPEARTLRATADSLMKESKKKRLEALRGEVGASSKQLEKVDNLLQLAAAIPSKDGETAPEAEKLVKEAHALSETVDLGAITNYRILKRYVALANCDPVQLELHPRHLMAACLRLARQYTGRRDDVDRNMKLFGDDNTVTKILHAERCILKALDYRIAKHLVGRDEHGQRLPDTRLYRADLQLKPRSPSSPGLQHLFSTSPSFLRGLFSPTPK